MKKVIPFSKEILFNNKIEEITSISIDNTLKHDNNLVSGEFLINGTYKINNDSTQDEEFNYSIPVDITIDNKYNTSKCVISIDDFSYEIINEESLRVNISVMIDNLDIKDDPIETIEIESIDRDLGLEEKEVEEASVVNNNSNNKTINVDIDSKVNINSPKEEKTLEEELLNNMDSKKEYSIYRVYTMKEDDTIDSILDKYNITKELLSDYNDLDNLKVGDKIIIPNVDD